MTVEIGLTGLGLLALMSLLFGVAVQLILWKSAPRWLWLVGSVAWFAGGFVFSEGLFGTKTEEEIQPIIDGLALDESALGGFLVGLPIVVVAWLLARRRHPGPAPA